MNLLRFWKMLKKYSQQSFYMETYPRLAIIPPDFQLNSQNSITLLSLRSVPEKRTIQFKESELETGASRGDFAAISIPRHGYVGGSRSSIRLDPADLRNKISGWTHIFVSVGWRSLFAPSIHRVRSSAHNPRRATVSRVSTSRPRVLFRALTRVHRFVVHYSRAFRRKRFATPGVLKEKPSANWACEKKKVERICFSRIKISFRSISQYWFNVVSFRIFLSFSLSLRKTFSFHSFNLAERDIL